MSIRGHIIVLSIKKKEYLCFKSLNNTQYRARTDLFYINTTDSWHYYLKRTKKKSKRIIFE